jgi:anti-sigma28 factor (negative regulator of flagellin synthesis)
MSFESEPIEPGKSETPLNRFSNLRYHAAHSPHGDDAERTDPPEKDDARSRRRRRKKSPDAGPARRGDMEVRGPGFIPNATPIQGVRPTTGPAAAASKPPLEVPQDEVELSAAGQLMGKITEGTEAAQRAERLARIKAEIDGGTYDTDAKLEAALLKMFDRNGIDLEA